MTEEVLYLDSSAIVKLAVPEPETGELWRYVLSFERLASSVVAAVEVGRAIRRAAVGRAGARRAEAALERISLLDLDEQILRSAGRIDPSELRTLDALHLASALVLGDDLAGLCTYDRRLAEASAANGVDAFAPS